MGTDQGVMRDRGYLLGGYALVVLSLYIWTFWFYPVLGHDLSMVVPAMWEMADAWKSYGVLDIDFSPFRCLGLPHFSNPNSFLWSLYHAAALFLRESNGVFVVECFVAGVSYLGATRLFQVLGFDRRTSVLWAMGWCLQGFCLTHAVAGHTNYYQFALLPFLLGMLLQKDFRWWMSLAFSFWVAHLLYTSGYYILLIGFPSLILSAYVLQLLLPERFKKGDLCDFRGLCWNVVKMVPWVLVLVAPKVLGVLNFTAKFPRIINLDQIGLWQAFVYTLSHYLWPFPYDVNEFTGWWYGNWESYEFLFPGLVYAAAPVLWMARKKLPLKTAGILLAIIVVCGTVLSSGIMAPVFHRLPLLKSLHVNPRWNSFVLLPFACWILALLLRAGKKSFSLTAVTFLAVAFVGTPFLYLDRENMQIKYPDRAGIDFGRGRLQYCYEPIFGYGLEAFPLGRQVNWFSDTLVDPRCYLNSNECRPGTMFGQAGSSLEDQEKLKRYALKDEYAPVKNFKKISLVFYFASFAAMLWLLVVIARDLWHRKS